jgi:hypothetical protein
MSLSISKEQSVFVVLPNLKYIDKNVYFILKRPVKIQKDGKIEYHNKILLNNLSLRGKLNYMNYELKCSILQEEIENGLKVNIKFIKNNDSISNQIIQKFARAIESMILNIDITEDESFEEELYEGDNYSYISDDIGSNQDNEYEEDCDDDYYY